MLNFGLFTGQDGRIQHADRFAGVYGYLEGKPDRWYAAVISAVHELIFVAVP